MKNFIEVTNQGRSILLNVNQIIAVKIVSGKVRIITQNREGEHPLGYTLEESYEDVKSLINDALK